MNADLRPATVEPAGDGVYVVTGVGRGDAPMYAPRCRMTIRRRARNQWILELDAFPQAMIWRTLRAARYAASAAEYEVKP